MSTRLTNRSCGDRCRANIQSAAGARVIAAARAEILEPRICLSVVSFLPAVHYDTGAHAINFARGTNAVAVGDFNGDYLPDLAVGNGNETVSILLNHGDGTFAPANSFHVRG